MSPVLAKVIIISSALSNAEAEPDTYEELTTKYPVSSLIEDIVNIAKSLGSNLFDILKWPLIVEVESSMVLKNG
jgi:hypothetical protein